MVTMSIAVFSAFLTFLQFHSSLSPGMNAERWTLTLRTGSELTEAV